MVSTHAVERAGIRDASMRVLERVAELEGVDPLEFDQVLHDVVDPDALDAFLRRDGVTVEFTYLGYDVRISSDGTLDVD